MKKRNRSITADLTPLLDVIFILLFLILIRNTEASDAKAAEADAKMAEAQEQMAEAQALRDAVQGQLDEYDRNDFSRPDLAAEDSRSAVFLPA